VIRAITTSTIHSGRNEHVRLAGTINFDEAHHNFHATSGRYRAFAELIAHDGYEVLPSKDLFTLERLARGDVLVIANALGANPGAGSSAFTEAECDAVRDWGRLGGALLLITDHDPFGAASESLAKRFGVGMSKGFTSDPENSEGDATSLVFTRKNKLPGTRKDGLDEPKCHQRAS
jgi:hypothetical protein